LTSWTEKISTEHNPLLDLNFVTAADSTQDLCALVQEYEDIDDLPQPLRFTIDRVAVQLSEQIVKDFSGPSNVKKLKKIYSNIPFRTMGLLSRLTDPKAMVLGSISIALANPMGMQSLLQRVIRAAIPKSIAPSAQNAREELIRAMGDSRTKDSIRSIVSRCMQPLEAIYNVVPIHEVMSKLKGGISALIETVDQDDVDPDRCRPIAQGALREIWCLLRRLLVSEQGTSVSVETALRWMIRVAKSFSESSTHETACQILHQLFAQRSHTEKIEIMKWVSTQHYYEVKKQEYHARKSVLKAELRTARKQRDGDYASTISEEISTIRGLIMEESMSGIVPSATVSPFIQEFHLRLVEALRSKLQPQSNI
jgi:hypothetical protein